MVSGSVLEMGRAGAEELVMSKADTYKRIAVCPFFRAAYDRTIYCEPVIEEAEQMRISFKTYRACKDHIKHRCASLEGCKTCTFYQTRKEK